MERNGREKDRGKKRNRRGDVGGVDFSRSHGMNQSFAEQVKSAARLAHKEAMASLKGKHLVSSGELGFLRKLYHAALLRSLVDNWVTKSEAKVMLQDVDPVLGVNLVLHTRELLQGNVSDPNRKLSLEKLSQKFDRPNTPRGKGFITMMEGYLKSNETIPISNHDVNEILQKLDEKKGEEGEDDDKTEKRVLGLGKEAEGWVRLMCNTVRPPKEGGSIRS